VASRVACIPLCVLVVLGAWPDAPAEAQGSFQSQLGRSAPARSSSPPALSPYRSTYGWRPYSRYQDRPFQEEETEASEPYERGGTLRTLCVRMCDGFYFPISSATTRSDLARDADKCSALCSADAQLFYYSNAGGSIDTMVDLMGRAYSSLPNAFKYRHTLVKGCRCRPQPWSEAELERHRSYDGPPLVADAKPLPAPGDGGQQSVGRAPATPRLETGRSENAPIDRANREEADPDDDISPPAAGGDDAGVTIITSHRAVPRPEPIERGMQVPPSWHAGSGRPGASPYAWPADGAHRGR
jgi:hypothetical protein